jgi:hypothetical protein
VPDASVRIDRLRVRVRGADGEAARAALAGLGPALLARLAPQFSAAGVGRRAFADVDLGSVTAGAGDPAAVRAAMVDALAGALAARLPGGEGRQA